MNSMVCDLFQIRGAQPVKLTCIASECVHTSVASN
jgi:hypothetical protein